MHSVGGGGVAEMSRGGVGDAPRRADGRRGWDAGASEDEFATHTISHLEIGFFFEALLRLFILSRGSRGGYPLVALGSEGWSDAIHAGVFSGGRPSVHWELPLLRLPRLSSREFRGSDAVTPYIKPET